MTVSPATFLQPFEPLTTGQYPVFNRFPEFIVNYQTKMKDRIRQDEHDYLKKRFYNFDFHSMLSNLCMIEKSSKTLKNWIHQPTQNTHPKIQRHGKSMTPLKLGGTK